VKVDYIGLVNLIAGREVCPEFIQNECTAANLHEHALRLLGAPEHLSSVRNELQTISESFPQRSGERAARRLFATMEYWSEIPRELRQRMLRRGLGPV
jgi:lipid-A-disaccharide synthase